MNVVGAFGNACVAIAVLTYAIVCLGAHLAICAIYANRASTVDVGFCAIEHVVGTGGGTALTSIANLVAAVRSRAARVTVITGAAGTTAVHVRLITIVDAVVALGDTHVALAVSAEAMTPVIAHLAVHASGAGSASTI